MQKATVHTQSVLKNILFATDFSRSSNAALPYVLSLARQHHSTIFAVHVVSSPLAGSLPTLDLQAIAAQSLRETKEAMAALEPQLKGSPHELLIRRGDPWKELAAVIESNEIDLIVVGTHGRSGAHKYLMGSVAEQIFRQATCPVLTIGPHVCGEPDAIAAMRTILCPVDFSPESLEGVRYAFSLAEANEARVYLLHVTHEPADKMTEMTLKDRLLALAPAEIALQCAPKAYVVSGDAAEETRNLVEELGTDLIVLGVKGMARAARATTHLGMATAYKIVSQAICPVVTVRHGERSERQEKVRPSES